MPSRLFEPVQGVKLDPEMVKLAVQLVERQTGRYDPADLEDRYETRLRAMLDAKVAGVPVAEDAPARDDSNIIDLMAALRKSIGGPVGKPAAKKAKEPDRRQTGMKLPIAGGKKAAAKAEPVAAPEPVSRPRRKASLALTPSHQQPPRWPQQPL